MILKFFVLAISIIISIGCKHESLSNRFDELDLICGEGTTLSGENQFIRLQDQGVIFDPTDIQIFSESESGKIDVVPFHLTSRSCIEIKALQDKDFRSKISVIFKNRLAGQLPLKRSAQKIPIVELDECGDYCFAFPSCGLLEKSKRSLDETAVVLKIPTAKSEKINATLERESITSVLSLNERNCFLFPRDAKGILRIQDSFGNFLEKNADDAYRAGSSLSVSELNLRGPLDVNERLCKEKPLSYRIDGNRCVPKSIRYICEDSPTNPNLRVMALNFLKLDCKQIEDSLQKEVKIDFSYKDLFNAEVFSGLINLRELNLSVNYIADLNDLLGVPDLQILNLERGKVPFDTTSLNSFSKLKTLLLAGTQLLNSESIHPLSTLEELSITDTSHGFISKAPNLRRLILSGNDVDLEILSGLSKLEYLELSALGIKNLGALRNLTNLKKLIFNGAEINPEERLPLIENLESLNFNSATIPDLSMISNSAKLKTIEYYFGSDRPDFKLPSFPFVKSAKVSCENNDLACLTPFPNVENVQLQIDEISLDRFPAIESLKRLSINANEATGIDRLGVLVNIEALDLGFAPKIVELSNFPRLSKLTHLEVGTSGNPEISDLSWLNRVPNLRSLKISIDATESLKADNLPSTLEYMDLTAWGLKNLQFLKSLTNLKELKLAMSSSDLENNQDFEIPNVEKISIQADEYNLVRFPAFPRAIDASIQLAISDRSDPEEKHRVATIFPTIQNLQLQLFKSNMLLLKEFKNAKNVVLYTTDADLSDLPFLPAVTTFKLSSAQLEDLNGIENFPEIRNIEFINGNKLKNLRPLLGLKRLEKIIGSRFIRRNFTTATSCPDTTDSPPPLRDYCSDIMMPIVRTFGPATF